MKKIIIPTNDRETIAVHIGRCLEFAVYTVDKGNVIALEFEKNNLSHLNGKNAGKDSQGICGHQEIVRLFYGADLILYYTMGKNLRKLLDENGLPYQKAKSIYMKEIIKEIL
jgi:predicted Fe-Mo cluster-binding NifX family protein